MIERLKFFDVFQKNPDGSLTPRYVINVGGVTFGPGVAFGQGVSFGGVNFFQYQNNDVAIEKKDGVSIIKGFYTT
ncbi:MAG: hypothetical protein ACYDCN_15305 [Bacteroidia bacterium]